MGLVDERVCIVTGAGRGIGREYALALAAHGARVVVNDLGASVSGTGADESPAQQVVAEIIAAGGTAVASHDDIASWTGAENLVDLAVRAFGRLDVVVNNAGILRDRMLTNMTEEEWDSVIHVHLKGTFCMSRHASAYWKQQAKAGAGIDARLINTTSVSGIYGNPGQTNYGAAKAGIASFTIIAARELERYGVTANCIAPGAITRMTEALVDEEGARDFGPEWVAPVCVWLASHESKEVTGQVVEASGHVLAIASGWERGRVAKPSLDPAEAGDTVLALLQEARPNSVMPHA